MKKLPLIVFAMLATAIPMTAWAQAAADEEETELNVTAERMEVQIDGKTIELTNNVRFEDDSMVLTADRMLIFLEDEPKDEPKGEKKDEKKEEAKEAKEEQKEEIKEKKEEPKGEKKGEEKKGEKKDEGMGNMKLKRIEAIGKVEVRSKGDATQSAAGNSAVYDVKTDSVTLSGDCVITQGDRTMKGNEVVFDRTQNKIFVKNADIRIRLKRGSKDKGLGNLLGGKKDDKDAPKKEEKKEEEKK